MGEAETPGFILGASFFIETLSFFPVRHPCFKSFLSSFRIATFFGGLSILFFPGFIVSSLTLLFHAVLTIYSFWVAERTSVGLKECSTSKVW